MQTNKGYAIKCNAPSKNGLNVFTLDNDQDWKLVPYNGQFPSLLQARQFFRSSKHSHVNLSVWIEGPLGGTHCVQQRKVKESNQ